MTSESEQHGVTFELAREILQSRRSNKWGKFPSDVLPCWVADMDFAVADPVQRAIARFVEQRDYGYANREGPISLAAAFAEHMQRRYDWSPDPELVQQVSELIQAMFASIMAFSEPGDGVVVQTPIYPPFLMAVEQTGRRLVENPLVDDGTRFVMDLDGLRRVIDDRTRVLLFCNPHNPTGRVFERSDLQELAQIALDRDLIVVSDEIHADLIYPGRQHVPLATIGPEIAARTITLTSATKSFNIPGLRCALMHVGSPELHERFFQVFPQRLLGQVNPIGIDATVAAWRHGQPWLEAVMERLASNRTLLTSFLEEELPEIRYHQPEGTYLSWLDCRALDLQPTPWTFFLEQARVGLSDGAEFGTLGRGHVRLNFATSEPILREALDRMAAAVRGRAPARTMA